MQNLHKECDNKLAQMKQANIDRFALPATSAGVIGQLAVNPLHPKYYRYFSFDSMSNMYRLMHITM